MQRLFSPRFKYTTWRRLWLALAKAQKELGLAISSEQITALEHAVDSLDFDLAAKYEKELQHDVMAHIEAYGDKALIAKGVIHIGATSAFVTDNTDLIQQMEGLHLLRKKLIQLLRTMGKLADQTDYLPTLSYTHFQPAQPTTVGKRICVWAQDLLLDLQDLAARQEQLRFLGLKGATGTQASFLELFDGDEKKALELDRLVAREMGLKNLFTIATQTYTRKQDMRILSTLEGLAASAHKCATDLRLLAHEGEVRESFGSNQVGSSAMPHKRNPIYAERVCALARFLISLASNGAQTLATQWLERSLDDSANRRIVLPEAFLTADALLDLLIQLFSHLQIDEETITKNLIEKLPLLSKENILMKAVRKGKDRQKIHEKLRHQHTLEEMAADPDIGLTIEELEKCLAPNIGMAPLQVKTFLEDELMPQLDKLQPM